MIHIELHSGCTGRSSDRVLKEAIRLKLTFRHVAIRVFLANRSIVNIPVDEVVPQRSYATRHLMTVLSVS
jgi:hypothetical protein